jgi:hypothetical protein
LSSNLDRHGLIDKHVRGVGKLVTVAFLQAGIFVVASVPQGRDVFVQPLKHKDGLVLEITPSWPVTVWSP